MLKKICIFLLIVSTIITFSTGCTSKKEKLQQEYDKNVSDLASKNKDLLALQIPLNRMNEAYNSLNSKGSFEKSYEAKQEQEQSLKTKSQAESRIEELKLQIRVLESLMFYQKQELDAMK